MCHLTCGIPELSELSKTAACFKTSDQPMYVRMCAYYSSSSPQSK